MIKRIFKNPIAALSTLSLNEISLICILILGLLLRLKGIFTKDIWYDEALTILQSQKTFLEIFTDVPTPIHYLITHLFTSISDRILVFRIPSIFFGLFSIYLLYLVGTLLINKKTGLIAAFLLTISPIHIEFSQQILFFSYYVFFSLLSLYFLLLYIQSLDKKTNWKYLLFFAIAAVINILNIMLALVVTAIEIIYLGLSMIFRQNRKLKISSILLLSLVIIAVGFAIYSIPGYKNFFNNLISFDFNKPITLGYSLSHRLNNINLEPSLKFLYLMFSWLGYGYGYNFLVLFIPFLLGLTALSISRHRRSLTLIGLWLVLPFIVLFIVRLDHWFEEKYFIFITPIYLLVCAYGVNILSLLIKKIINIDFSRFILIFFLVVALNSLKTTTSFGYSFDGHVVYDWNIVYRYLNEILRPGDKVILPKDGTLFLDIYFGDRAKDYIVDETTIAKLPADDYQKLINSTTTFYYVSIPDFNYLYLAPVTKSERLVSIGNFGIYKLKFLKQNPHAIVSDYSNWSYYEDFRTASYMAHAESWSNLSPSYAIPSFSPAFEGTNAIKPTSQNEATLSYQFTLPQNSFAPMFKPVFFLSPERKFQIFVGTSASNSRLVFEQATDKSNLFNPEINLSAYHSSEQIYLKLVFTQSKSDHDESFLKIINLQGRQPNAIDQPKFIIQDADNQTTYLYNSEFEVIKNPKWFTDTIESWGWFQTNEGFLVKYLGNENTSITYHLLFPKTVDMMKLQVKASNHYTNPLDAFYSTDGEKWQHLSMLNKNIPHIYEFELIDLSSQNVYLKFLSKLIGPSSQIRNINIEAISKKP